MLFRLAALLLLCTAAVCWADDLREDFYSPDAGTTQTDCADSGSNTDCFCCCAHVIPMQAAEWLAPAGTLYVEGAIHLAVADPPRLDIFQPPRA